MDKDTSTSRSTCSAVRSRPSKSFFCPHCGEYLTKKVYKTHQRIYYDGDTQQWVKKRHTSQSTDFLIDNDSESDLDQDRSSRSSSSNDCPPVVGFDEDGDSDEEVSDVVDEASLEEGNLAAWPFKHTPWITRMMTSRLLP